MEVNKRKISYPNILLVAGDGRNVGKTYFACKCIEHLSKSSEVIGVKITPHFHDFIEKGSLIITDDFVIIAEKKINKKDSSLMLQAGASKVYFVMCKREKLAEAFDYLSTLLRDNIVVVESGGLHEIIKPGLFFFMKNKDKEISKTDYLKFNPIIINNTGNEIDFDIQNIDCHNNKVLTK